MCNRIANSAGVPVITLCEETIDQTLRSGELQRGVERYCQIQAMRNSCSFFWDSDFQRRFNGFYRVRRNRQWQEAFYQLFQMQSTEGLLFSQVLRQLYRATNRVEASFASKLVATIDQTQPIIDSIVLKNLGLRLPRSGDAETRILRICQVHSRLAEAYEGFLSTQTGQYLVARFGAVLPAYQVAPEKMLDFVLWQLR